MKILITGCSSGLGKAISNTKSEHDIYFHFRSADDVPSGCNLDQVLLGNVNDWAFLNEFEKFIEINNIDVLINNAGIYSNKPIIDIDDEEIILLINTNLISQILLTKRAVKHFIKRKNGRIININSLAGKSGTSNESVYSASKFGLLGFSKSLQLELLEQNIYITDVFIGAMKTRMSELRKNYNELINPQEVADLIIHSLSHSDTLIQNEIIIRRK